MFASFWSFGGANRTREHHRDPQPPPSASENRLFRGLTQRTSVALNVLARMGYALAGWHSVLNPVGGLQNMASLTDATLRR